MQTISISGFNDNCVCPYGAIGRTSQWVIFSSYVAREQNSFSAGLYENTCGSEQMPSRVEYERAVGRRFPARKRSFRFPRNNFERIESADRVLFGIEGERRRMFWKFMFIFLLFYKNASKTKWPKKFGRNFSKPSRKFFLGVSSKVLKRWFL